MGVCQYVIICGVTRQSKINRVHMLCIQLQVMTMMGISGMLDWQQGSNSFDIGIKY